jgi:hypothetical protein
MTFVYIVRCKFTEPAKEQAWNDWYSGPKIAQMLAKPHFRTCQRFRLASGRGRDYLALWTLQSPDAFNSTEYRSDWGFFDWERYVSDWSRDLFDGGNAPESVFAVPSGGSLSVVSFDGMSLERAQAARDAMASLEPGMLWLPIVGLDRHTPLIGLAAMPGAAPIDSEGKLAPSGVQQAVYRPISEFHRAS